MVACRMVVYAILALGGEDISPISFVLESLFIALFLYLWARERSKPHPEAPAGEHERALAFLDCAERVVPPVAIVVVVVLTIVDVLIRLTGDAQGSLIWIGQLVTTILLALYLSLLLPARRVYRHSDQWPDRASG